MSHRLDPLLWPRSVAVIGAGPAGLACAATLRRLGRPVVVPRSTLPMCTAVPCPVCPLQKDFQGEKPVRVRRIADTIAPRLLAIECIRCLRRKPLPAFRECSRQGRGPGILRPKLQHPALHRPEQVFQLRGQGARSFKQDSRYSKGALAGLPSI